MPPSPPSPLTIQLFGPLRVLVHGQPLPRVRTRSVEWLLALLVLHHGRTLDRSPLAGTLWPDSDENQALHNLRDDLVRLRKALGSESRRLLSPSRDTLTFDMTGADVDLVAFDAAIRQGEEASLQQAIALYRRLLLEGCHEAWIFQERQVREQSCLLALETLARYAIQRGDVTDALALLRRAEGMDPLRDSIQRGLMRALAAQGDTPAALHTYREYRLRLHREMNAEPDDETARLFQQIRAEGRGGNQQIPPESEVPSRPPSRQSEPSSPLPSPPPGTDAVPPASPPSPAPLPPLPSLPHPLTGLIGREEAVRDVARLIAASRLVTLTGTGGVGKTRLSLQVALEDARDFPQGPVFVALAPLSDPALLPAFLATALGIREEGRAADTESLLQALARPLSAYPALLVLDNCEHLVEATATLCHTLLSRCPGLHILATSRQRLALTGEVLWRVPSLPTPDPEQLPSEADRALAQVLAYPAVRLFVERAGMVRGGFRLAGREEAEAVARICQRLDGIPLAIELAAARAGALTVDQIASRLSDRFRLLTGGSRGDLTRHQTLRALIDWSYDLLSEEERALLRRLSVFVGGWTLESAESVGAEQRDVLDLLASLADKSLVLAEAQATGLLRYRMLETVREYAREKLRESEEEEVARDQHLAYFLQLARETGPALEGPGVEAALSRLEGEIGNLRAALAWAQREGAPPETYVQFAAVMWPYWEHCGLLLEGRSHLLAALARAALGSAERAQLLLGAAMLALRWSDVTEAEAKAQESLAAFRILGDRRGSAAALLCVGPIARDRRDFARARALLTEALEESRRCGWTRGSTLALQHLGWVAEAEGDSRQAWSLLEEGLALAEEAGDPMPMALGLQGLGSHAFVTGDLGRGIAIMERALAIHRRLGHRYNTAEALGSLGSLVRRQGNLPRALSYLDEALALWREQGNRIPLAPVLQERGCILYELGKYASAAAAMSESLAIYRQQSEPYWIAGVSNTLGSTLFHLGDHRRAKALHREALAMYQQTESVEGIVWSLERLAVTEAKEGDPTRAARLLGAASAGREGLGKPMDRWDQTDWDRAAASVRAALGEATFAALYAAGRALSRDQGIALDGA
jgi:predicted ATPase/DNA-binding SARP family transcriptional activator